MLKISRFIGNFMPGVLYSSLCAIKERQPFLQCANIIARVHLLERSQTQFPLALAPRDQRAKAKDDEDNDDDGHRQRQYAPPPTFTVPIADQSVILWLLKVVRLCS